MSAKSRKRNKRLLALAGVITAGTLAARKNKADLASTEDGKSANTTIQDNKPKKDTAKKDTAVTTPKTIQDNKYDPKKGKLGTITQKDETGQNITKKITPFKNSGLTLGVSDRKVDKTANAVAKAKRDTSAGKLPPQLQNPGRKNITTDQQNFRNFFKTGKSDIVDRDTAAKDGGRMGLRSGGKVKGCGIAKRGFGKAMKGNR